VRPAPKSRYEHSALSLGVDPHSPRHALLLVVGGHGGRSRLFNDVSVLRLRTESAAQAWVPRASIQLAALSIYTSAANTAPIYTDEERKIDPDAAAWYEPLISGEAPEARFGHKVSLVGSSQAFLLGGRGHGPCGSLFCLDLLTWSWSRVLLRPGLLRDCYDHAMEAVGSKLIIFGGVPSPSQTLDTVTVFDTLTCEEQVLQVVGHVPVLSRFATAAFPLPAQGYGQAALQLVGFGGVSSANAPQASLFSLSLQLSLELAYAGQGSSTDVASLPFSAHLLLEPAGAEPLISSPLTRSPLPRIEGPPLSGGGWEYSSSLLSESFRPEPGLWDSSRSLNSNSSTLENALWTPSGSHITSSPLEWR
jgi:hypothetical protein